MTGIVLCGGNSTRMGTDKGLLKEEGETWAELAARKLKSLSLPVFISINAQQYPAYEQIFDSRQLITDDESLGAKAPLFGLFSTHLRLPNEDLFVLACDMKNMSPGLMQDLMDTSQLEKHDAFVYQTGEKRQPLCGIYSAKGLQTIYRHHQEGRLKRYSMMHVLEVLDSMVIAVPEDAFPRFNNYNHPEAL